MRLKRKKKNNLKPYKNTNLKTKSINYFLWKDIILN